MKNYSGAAFSYSYLGFYPKSRAMRCSESCHQVFRRGDGVDSDERRVSGSARLGGRVREARLLDGKNALYLNRHVVRQRNRPYRGAGVATAFAEHLDH